MRDAPSTGPELLRELRHRAGFTQETLAELAGVHVRAVRGLETGRVAAPRRSSIDLLARGLGLDVGDHLRLRAAWNIGDDTPPPSANVASEGRSPTGAPASTARIEVIEQFLARSRDTIRTVALTETVEIGADRRTSRRRTQEIAVALTDGVAARSVFYDPSDAGVDADRFHLSELENCRVGQELTDPGGTAKLFELRLDPPLRRGETQVLRYTADFLAARADVSDPTPVGSGEEITGFLRSPASYLLELRFHETALPSRLAQIFQARPTGPVRTVAPLQLTSGNTVHVALVEPRPGGHGIAWWWDGPEG